MQAILVDTWEIVNPRIATVKRGSLGRFGKIAPATNGSWEPSVPKEHWPYLRARKPPALWFYTSAESSSQSPGPAWKT